LVDQIPSRATWKTRHLSFTDRPGEKYRVHFRDPLEAIRSLWGDPKHAKDLVYAPKRVFSDNQQTSRIYSEMWTGKWWNGVQKVYNRPFSTIQRSDSSSTQKLPDGSTLAPVIIATDKTNLTQFSGNKCAYPVYLTLGNLPRAIRRKPSEHACILVAYLSVDKCQRGSFTKDFQRARNHRLFHESMRLILKSLKVP
jgi:hypothetical protein